MPTSPPRGFDASKPLHGKTCLITGGARGMGYSEAALFMGAGAKKVYVTDVLDGKEAAEKIGATYIAHDVTSQADWKAIVGRIVAEHSGPGPLDLVLVNNAGIYQGGGVDSTTVESFKRQLDVNCIGCFIGMQECSRVMKESGVGGSIINISSVAGLAGAPTALAYGASKWAVRGMTKSAATELGPSKIRVNSIHPGLISTNMLHDKDKVGVPTDVQKVPSSIIPLGRIAHVDEVGRVCLFLASDASSFMSGAELAVDAGQTASL